MPEASIRTCYQSTFSKRICDVCRKIADPVHLPTGRIGHFCSKCCPVCNPKIAVKKK